MESIASVSCALEHKNEIKSAEFKNKNQLSTSLLT